MKAMTAYGRVRDSFRSLFAELTEGYSSPRILVAFSGGADSTLLLHLMHEEGIDVLAAHVNHGIRGDEADRDEAFCRQLCLALGVPFFTMKIDVPALTKEWGVGTEVAAREARYAYLQQVANEQSCLFLATAHHADDNLETILFHLARGAALKGLCGIPPRRGNVIRPLLGCVKEDILEACRERAIPFVTDSTNEDTSFARNYLRAEILPRLRTLNPKVASAAYATARCLSRDEEHLLREASEHGFAEGRERLAALPDAILSRVLIFEMRKAGLSPENGHIEDAMGVIRSDASSTRLSVPGGTLLLDRNTVSALTDNEESSGYEVALHVGLNVLNDRSALYVGDPGAEASKDINKLKNIYKFAIKASVDSVTIERTLYARTRRPGDTYRYGGMTRHVKKLLQSQKTTAALRSQWPLLVKDETVVWIPGFPPADTAKTRDGGQAVTLYYFFDN